MKKEKRIEIWNKYGKRCAYCGCLLEYKDMQADHYYPQANPELAIFYYGVDINSDENFMPSCRQCNYYKGSSLPEHFRYTMKTLHERIDKSTFIVKLGIKYGIVKIQPFDGSFYFERLNREADNGS